MTSSRATSTTDRARRSNDDVGNYEEETSSLRARVRELEAELQQTDNVNWHVKHTSIVGAPWSGCIAERLRCTEARVAEADRVIERLSEGGVTWNGTAYIGFAREKEDC